MKKYISFLSLASALLMQSCERSDADMHMTEQRSQNLKAIGHKESVKTENNSSTAKEDSDSLEKDSKDEPKRDKQHWKSKKDTIYEVQP